MIVIAQVTREQKVAHLKAVQMNTNERLERRLK